MTEKNTFKSVPIFAFFVYVFSIVLLYPQKEVSNEHIYLFELIKKYDTIGIFSILLVFFSLIFFVFLGYCYHKAEQSDKDGWDYSINNKLAIIFFALSIIPIIFFSIIITIDGKSYKALSFLIGINVFDLSYDTRAEALYYAIYPRLTLQSIFFGCVYLALKKKKKIRDKTDILNR